MISVTPPLPQSLFNSSGDGTFFTWPDGQIHNAEKGLGKTPSSFPPISSSFSHRTPFELHKLAHYGPMGAPSRLIKRSFASALHDGLATPLKLQHLGDATCYSTRPASPAEGTQLLGTGPWPELTGDAWCSYYIVHTLFF